jgi:hypothetical protein
MLNKIVNGVEVQCTAEEETSIRAEWATNEAKINAHAYIAKRAAEFPPITDYIDGVVKGDQAQIDKYIADCLAVKARHPKGVA